jgi:cbb3-type cytochrome oxidase subunit 3
VGKPLVMDNNFFVLSLLVIALLTLFGMIMLPLIGIGVIIWYLRKKEKVKDDY